MFHLDNTSGVPEMPEPKPRQSNSPRWFGESEAEGGISWPGADWFNTVQAELLAILELAEELPDKTKFNQISQAISKLANTSVENIWPILLDNGAEKIGLPYGTVLNAITFYTPEMFGCKGDGKFDDYDSFQNMLDIVPVGGTIFLDGSKKYYNAFANAAGPARNWIRSKALTIMGNGAKLTRATPAKNVDMQTAILSFTGEGPFNVHDIVIDGNNPIGQIYKYDGSQAVSGHEIALCQSIDYGILATEAQKINLYNVEIYRCAFNIWMKACERINVTGYLHHSGQVITRITSTDQAYGAGIKLSDCRHFSVSVNGDHNTNATVEVEPNNQYGKVRQWTKNNINQGAVVYDSSDIDIISYTDGTQSGPGTNIVRGANSGLMKNITATIVSDNCYDSGCRVYMTENAAGNIEQLTINVLSSRAKTYGTDIRNLSSNYFIDIRASYDGVDNVSPTFGNDLWIFGDVRGYMKARSRGCYCGVICTGNNSSYGLHIDADLQEVPGVPFSQGASMNIDWTGTKTVNEYKILPNVPQLRIARSNVGGGTRPFTDIAMWSGHFYFRGMPSQGAFSNELYYNAETKQVVIHNPS